MPAAPELVDAPTAQPGLAAGRPVQAAQQVQRRQLPHPLGPMTATVSPAATSRSTPSTARASPIPCRTPCAGAALARGRGRSWSACAPSSSAHMPPTTADRPAGQEHERLQQQRRSEPSAAAIAARCRVAQPRRSRIAGRRRWRWVGQPGGTGGDELEVEVGEVGATASSTSVSHAATHTSPAGRPRVDLAGRPIRRADRRHQPGVLQHGSARRRCDRRSSPRRAADTAPSGRAQLRPVRRFLASIARTTSCCTNTST